MSYITKPSARHPRLPTNAIGLTVRDYEGSMSTLCAGCGHDSVTAALVQTFFELDVEPYRVAKLSGIGCSSKTPAYFVSEAHGFNSVHGRMPAIAAGANAANRDLLFVGISGDGEILTGRPFGIPPSSAFWLGPGCSGFTVCQSVPGHSGRIT